MIIYAINAPETEHLVTVTAEMQRLGAPRIKAINVPALGGWLALEGSHRLAAAHALHLTPEIEEVDYDTYEDTPMRDLVDDYDYDHTLGDFVDRVGMFWVNSMPKYEFPDDGDWGDEEVWEDQLNPDTSRSVVEEKSRAYHLFAADDRIISVGFYDSTGVWFNIYDRSRGIIEFPSCELSKGRVSDYMFRVWRDGMPYLEQTMEEYESSRR